MTRAASQQALLERAQSRTAGGVGSTARRCLGTLQPPTRNDRCF